LMIEGSVFLDCMIFGRLRPVNMVRKRCAMLHQSAVPAGRQIVNPLGAGAVRVD
jgi:hypothetical protein